jgi:hypothetical protein
MALSRRKFLGVAAGTAAAAGGVQLLRTTVFDDDGTAAAPDSERFRSAVGTTFNFRVDALSTVPMRLAGVDDAPADPRVGELTGEAFTLAFESTKRGRASFGQGTYAVQHAALGRFPLFVAPERGTGTYAAVINRRVPKASR